MYIHTLISNTGFNERLFISIDLVLLEILIPFDEMGNGTGPELENDTKGSDERKDEKKTKKR